MSDSANVTSLEAIAQFAVAVLQFQSEARLCLTALDAQLRQVQSWLERDRPVFWKHEIESCTRAVADARIRLHQCRMRRVGDFRPTCFEEQKDLEQARRSLEFSQKQVPAVKRWSIAAQHEANEFHGRSSQMTLMLERELPRLLALLKFSLDRLEAYAATATPAARAVSSQLTRLVAQLEAGQLAVATEVLETPAETSSGPEANPAGLAGEAGRSAAEVADTSHAAPPAAGAAHSSGPLPADVSLPAETSLPDADEPSPGTRTP